MAAVDTCCVITDMVAVMKITGCTSASVCVFETHHRCDFVSCEFEGEHCSMWLRWDPCACVCTCVHLCASLALSRTLKSR